MLKKIKSQGSKTTYTYTRRQFLGTTTSAAAAAFAFQFVPSSVFGANSKLAFAAIGVGGKGYSDSAHAGSIGDMVAICDIDAKHLSKCGDKFRKAKQFQDFRVMMDKLGSSIDAVTISTPDHTHTVAASLCMKMGKHVYVQKPLTHDVWEARYLRELATKTGVCTQMGNQGTATHGLRRAVEIVRAGTIGDVTEIHAWTNRPVWPQSPKVTQRLPEQSIPDHVNWDLFLGTAPKRPYNAGYHPFKWRGWWDYGTGALGDMACHTLNMPFMALKLESPTSISAQNEKLNPETFPGWASIVYEFPARGDMPPVKLFWYEGRLPNGKLNVPNAELFHGHKPTNSGSLMVGTKGNLYSPGDYGSGVKLLPVDTFKGFKVPKETLPRIMDETGQRLRKNDAAQKIEWAQAIRANKPQHAMANFDYSGFLTEAALLGNVAMQAGTKLEFNAEKLEFTNNAKANQFLKRTYANGWTV